MGHKAGHYGMSMGEKEKNTPGNFSQKDNETISKSTAGKMARRFEPTPSPESAGPRPRGTNYDPDGKRFFTSKKMEYSDKRQGYTGYGKVYDESDGTFKGSKKQASKDLKKVTKAGKMIFKSM